MSPSTTAFDVTVEPDTDKLGPIAYALANAIGDTEPTSTRKGIKQLRTNALAALRGQVAKGEEGATREQLALLGGLAVVLILLIPWGRIF